MPERNIRMPRRPLKRSNSKECYFREAANAGVEYILLDNMSNEMMAQAIQIIDGHAKTEASGNITLERLPSMRNLGLDYISSGALTHSAKAIDIGLDILPAQQNA